MNLSEHTVLSTKIFIFIIISGYLFYNYNITPTTQGFSFPPWTSKCPDRWEVHGKGCKNVKKIGNCSIDIDDNMKYFTDNIFKGEDGPYFKCQWAKNCNTPWEGIDKLCI